MSRTVGWICLWLWLSWTAMACGTAPPSLEGANAEIPPATTEVAPHVAVVLIDQLRADRLGAYGSRLGLTPRLDELAENGLLFANARSAAPWTYPSVSSLLTGLYPAVHRANRLNSDPESAWIRQLSDEVTTLPELLSAAGYATAGFVANPYLKPESHLDQGFAHYEHDFTKSWGVDPSNSDPEWWMRNSYAEFINRRVGEYVGARGAAPLFLYVHYIDVHGPWDFAPFLQPGETETLSELELYHRSIRYTDAKVGELYDELNRELDGNLLFFVVADHGRALTEQDTSSPLKLNKASLHDFNLAVPLIVAGTRFQQANGVVDDAVSLVDVAPTILDLIGYAATGPAPRFDGTPMTPAIQGRPLAPRPIFAEVDDATQNSRARGMVNEMIKTVAVERPLPARLSFDLRSDPYELSPPLAAAATAPASFRTLDEHFEGMAALALMGEGVEVDEETIERLRSLGYIQ